MTHAAELRTAAGRTPDRALAALLATLADAADHPSDATTGLLATVLHPALAVARGIRDTTQETHMPDTTPTTPADKLHAAADRARKNGDPLHTAIAALLDGVMSSCREVAHEECQRWCSPTTCDLSAALAVARQVLGTTDQQPTTTPADRQTLAAALDGLHTLIATSSRDWQTYRVDAWIWAVLCGWDCEQAEHDGTCTHGALEETAAMHGWDSATVAKARRYRAAVRRMADEAQQPETEACTCDSEDHTHDSGCPLAAPDANDPAFPAADQPDTETEASPLCGKTVGVSGIYYRPCARPAGHHEAYCRDATGDHLFLAAADPHPAP
ncbi:hypothetical protein [Streptomyces sp. LN549]|uniref:hypothetical protein n=1 Tax=Streptomyces sp. LN549 TaxID=3112979 RepID=UPI003718036C